MLVSEKMKCEEEGVVGQVRVRKEGGQEKPRGSGEQGRESESGDQRSCTVEVGQEKQRESGE